ncbi:MAG: anhydro-N-acetylmuramic acid kinase, partial [Chlorobi bacterium]|nr:anhydro-N-acetylmuramic acid kinase [Chlorobiota bacterium]
SESMNVLDNAKVLITGGGTHNSFFISLLKKYCKHNVTIPEKQIIDFKEAIIFAFLGYLRKYRKINTFSSVTGAEKDSSGGSIFII